MAAGIRIVPYRPALAGDWDAFVAASNNGTVFHRQAFLGYHRGSLADGFRHLLFYRGEKLAAVLPLGTAGDGEARSPWGASFGGPVTADSAYAHQAGLVEALLAHARAEGLRRLLITPAPWPYHRHADASLEFCLLRAGFRLENRDLCNVIDLSLLGAGDPPDTFSYACDKQIRKARREGLTARASDDLETFHAILVENRRKHGTRPTHDLEDLRRLRAALGPDLALFAAYRGGTMEAGVLCFAANARVALNFYSAHREESAASGANNLANWQTMAWARERGFRYYDFGTSSLRMDPNDGLIRFKESFGPGGALRDTFRWEDGG